ncbi:MAG TPA: neutral/alkaline non-lysosomal ceramidase N-terminal domain-containing protein [Planctomycetaceae bacterium]|nr:neutral/alkaline non-lysosomal ceramidase N-terminal domain-containing protein [Planctomycetaceae bacterium]
MTNAVFNRLAESWGADNVAPLTPNPSPVRGEGESAFGRSRWITLRHCVTLSLIILFASTGPLRAADALWKVGTAKAVITPKERLWMAGYSSRTSPADATLHELYVRVLALEDTQGHRAVLVSSDLLGIPRSISENVSQAVASKFGLPREALMLNASHTHCGPVLRGALYDAYPLEEAQKKLIADYSSELESTIVRSVGEALAHTVPASVSIGQGTTDFAVNRRNNREPDVPALRGSNALRGPVDHSVPVLAVRQPDGKLLAVVFGYACHNTTLGIQQWNGDYAGFAESNLERAHPGAVALFFMGCGADQNPIPRRTVELAHKYGDMMSSAVQAVLAGKIESLPPKLKTHYETVTLNLGAAPTRAELTARAHERTAYTSRWGTRLLKELDAGRTLPRTYPYPIEVWELGGKQLWIALGGEVVVDYALRFKDRYGSATWVSAYANDVMAYIPTLRVLKEGGYEGNSSMMVYGMPAERWGIDVEEIIAAGVDRAVQKVQATK